MSFFDLSLPSGVYGNGTALQARGRWRDGHLVRFTEKTVRPVGGWIKHGDTPAAVAGQARAILTWKDNGNGAWIGIGTHTGLYAMTRSGALHNITPAGFAPGRPHATLGGGYGLGGYGVGFYGTPRPDTQAILDATVWTLDTWGEDLVGMNADDGKVYEWALDTGVVAAPVANAPDGRALIVTNERILMVLGARNPRGIDWSDSEDNTEWTPGLTTQAGSFDLQTAGRLMCGKRLTGETGLWTDIDFWTANYTADPLVYSFNRKGSGCGIISQQAVAVIDAQAAWMSQNGFWTYNGFVQPLECDVFDRVFSNLNRTQASKIYAVHNSSFGEVWWFYPSGSSNEIDSYVAWNYREGHWCTGALKRLCGTDRGVFGFPMMVGDSSVVPTDGYVYEHENGWDYTGSAAPFLLSGPIQLGSGDNVAHALSLVADEKTQGDVQVSFDTRFQPNSAVTSYGPYAISAAPTDVRFCARQIEVRIEGATPSDWRWGAGRLDIRAGGGR